MQDEEDGGAERQSAADRQEETLQAAIWQSVKEERARREKKRGYFSKAENWVSFGTLLFVIIYTAVTCLLWWGQIVANSINRSILAASEAASVYFGSTAHFRDIYQPDGSLAEGVVVTVGNSGGSTTRELTYSVACAILPANVDNPYSQQILDQAKIERVSIAPKYIIETMACKYPAFDFLKLVSDKRTIAVFGRAAYRDTIDPAAVHHVEFCLRMSELSIAGPGISTMQAECRSHNCTDDECAAG